MKMLRRMRMLAGLVALLLPAALAAQAAPAPPAPAAPRPATQQVVVETALGPITIEVETERAPVTAANFLRYVDQRRLVGATFYRAAAAPGSPDYGLVQFGLQNAPKKSLPPIAHEPTSKTRLSHVDGTVSMARGAPGTAASEFFIIVGDMPSLDADPAAAGDNLGFAAFGRVVEGMEIVRRILAAPVSPTLGEGAMKGQMLADPIPVTAARRLP
jgi:peptidyl-prolyl cis-trans isomerase A (cyclophilin A)